MIQVEPTSDPRYEGVPTWFIPGVRGIGLASFLAVVGHAVPVIAFVYLVLWAATSTLVLVRLTLTTGSARTLRGGSEV